MQSQEALGRSGEDAHPRGAQLVLSSLAAFPGLAARGRLRLRTERLGRSYRLCGGRSYRVFRETVRPLPDERRTVIEVCFRLKLIRAARLPHWLFQRLCILTTPFWSGFDGFGTKLWMVDPDTGSYAGIYQWSAPPGPVLISTCCCLCCEPCRCRIRCSPRCTGLPSSPCSCALEPIDRHAPGR
jgi:hypothetical protein